MISHEHDEELIVFFGDIDIIFKVIVGLKLPNLSQKVLVCMLFYAPLAGMLSNLHAYIIGALHTMIFVVGGISFLWKQCYIFYILYCLSIYPYKREQRTGQCQPRLLIMSPPVGRHIDFATAVCPSQNRVRSVTWKPFESSYKY